MKVLVVYASRHGATKASLSASPIASSVRGWTSP